MRLERSLKNSTAALLSQIISMGLGFITRTVFMRTLSQEYLGLNGLFLSFLSLLSLSELGIGTAITYALYKPLAEGDEEQISALMNLYSKAYRIIGLVVGVLGIVLYPFIELFVGELPEVMNIDLIYGLFLANTVLSYFFSYRRALISANQLDYFNTFNQALFLVIQNILQIILLLTTHNYILYLCTQIVCVFISNLVITRRSNKLFPYLRENRHLRVSKETFLGIRKNVAAMLMHQIGAVLVTGTDNMMIAAVNISLLAVYSNYSLITQTLNTILRQMLAAVTASVGNLIATEDLSRQYTIYRRIMLINFWLYGFFAAALFVLLDAFVTAWAPEGYLLPRGTTFLIVLNFYLFGMRRVNTMYVDAAGLFWPLRYKSITEALINLGASLYFLVVMKLGINGVLLGTVVSTLTTNFWWEPYTVVRGYLKQSLSRYFLSYGAYSLLAVGGYFLAAWLCAFIPGSGWLAFIAKGVVCSVSINALFALVLWRTDGVQYLREKVFSLLGRYIKRG